MKNDDIDNFNGEIKPPDITANIFLNINVHFIYCGINKILKIF